MAAFLELPLCGYWVLSCLTLCTVSTLAMCYLKPWSFASQYSSPLTHILSHSAAEVARSSKAMQSACPQHCYLCSGPQHIVGQSELHALRLGGKADVSHMGLQGPLQHPDFRIMPVPLYSKASFLRRNHWEEPPMIWALPLPKTPTAMASLSGPNLGLDQKLKNSSCWNGFSQRIPVSPNISQT